MQFMPHKKRHAPSVIIVSLIDVLMVVLIFLVVTTQFKQQPVLKLALPESKEAKSGARENAPLVVTIDKKEPYLYLADRAVTLDKLEAELKSRAATNPKLSLAIRASQDAPWGQVVKVMDVARAANIKMVDAFTAKPALGK